MRFLLSVTGTQENPIFKVCKFTEFSAETVLELFELGSLNDIIIATYSVGLMSLIENHKLSCISVVYPTLSSNTVSDVVAFIYTNKYPNEVIQTSALQTNSLCFLVSPNVIYDTTGKVGEFTKSLALESLARNCTILCPHDYRGQIVKNMVLMTQAANPQFLRKRIRLLLANNLIETKTGIQAEVLNHIQFTPLELPKIIKETVSKGGQKVGLATLLGKTRIKYPNLHTGVILDTLYNLGYYVDEEQSIVHTERKLEEKEGLTDLLTSKLKRAEGEKSYQIVYSFFLRLFDSQKYYPINTPRPSLLKDLFLTKYQISTEMVVVIRLGKTNVYGLGKSNKESVAIELASEKFILCFNSSTFTQKVTDFTACILCEGENEHLIYKCDKFF